MGKNRLSGEASPYLLQHKDNPVHWWPWGKPAFAAARAEDKPVLLSIGYAACHWCHVMAHESFEDNPTADLMNRLFINIKVDREERPDLDALYQRALQMMGQQGGWPLTMFLDANAEPFWGGTYFPNRPFAGRPTFQSVLEQIAKVYKEDPDAILKNRSALAEGLKQGWQTGLVEDIQPSVFFAAARLAFENMDLKGGGFKGAPKFPSMPQMNALWRAGFRENKNNYKLFFEKTLTMICQGGIYDHLGGGFCRYSTDAFWLVPHFEKMLYDNALILGGLCDLWLETQNPLFEKRIEETIGWLEREMKLKGGAFAAALDADSEGKEGKFYVWTRDEIEAALGSDAEIFCRYYGVEPGGNWEGKTILHRLYQAESFDPKEDNKIEVSRKNLLKLRAKRPRPFLDDKILTDWNGLLIAALVKASLAFGKPRWLNLAEDAFGVIETKLVKSGRLYHSCREGVLGPPAMIDDFAALIGAAIALYSATGKKAFLKRAKAWSVEAEKNLRDKKAGGFFVSGLQDPPLVARPKSIFDNATPSGNGLMIGNYHRLYCLTGREGYREKAENLLRVFAKAARENPLAAGTYFSAFDSVRFGAHLFIKGERGAKPVEEMLTAARSVCCPGLTIQTGVKASGLPEAKGLKSGQAVLCRGQVCSLPISDPERLKSALYDIRVAEEI